MKVFRMYFGDRVDMIVDRWDMGDEEKRGIKEEFSFLVMMLFIVIEKMGKNNFRGCYYVFFFGY